MHDIECPHCRGSFKLDETLAAPLLAETRRALQEEFSAKERTLNEQQSVLVQKLRDADGQQTELQKARAALSEEKERLDQTVATRLEEERAAIARAEAKKALEKHANEIARHDEERAELKGVIEERDAKLAEARAQELEYRRKERELDDKLKAFDLEVVKKVGASLETERARAKQEAVDEYRLREAEKDKQLADQRSKLEEMQRKLDQGSQQLQGEVQEVELERLLKQNCPFDRIEPVPTGQRGADVFQYVKNTSGRDCGSVLWESKRTQHWQDGWLPKLRTQQREAKADVAIIVSQALPKDVATMALVDGVIVTSWQCAIPIAALVRQQLITITQSRQVQEGRKTKMEQLYDYLTGISFRQRVEEIVEALTAMQRDLAQEKRAYEKYWGKREKQMERVITATGGMCGDLEGIAGRELPEIKSLQLESLDVESTSNVAVME